MIPSFRTDEPSFLADHVTANFDHVHDGNVFGNAHDEFKAGVDSLKNRIGGEGGGHVNDGSRRARSFDRVLHRVENGNALDDLPRLAGCHAADNLRAVSEHLFRVEGRRLARYALDDYLRVPVSQNQIYPLP